MLLYLCQYPMIFDYSSQCFAVCAYTFSSEFTLLDFIPRFVVIKISQTVFLHTQTNETE